MRRRPLLIGLLLGLLLSPFSHANPLPQVRFETTLGAFTVELDSERAPQTVANFLRYVDEGFYNGTIFHRVIQRFVVQAGGFTPEMVQRATHEPVVNESGNGLFNDRFTLAMARTSDPDSATSQFYINLRMNPSLDSRNGQPGYTVFGQVIEGQETLKQISYQPVRPFAGHQHLPLQPIVITSAQRLP